MQKIFTLPEVWLGGHFELAMEVGETSNNRLFAVLDSVWSHSALYGCYLASNKEPHEQEKVKPLQKHIQSYHLLGIATLPNGNQVACGTHSVREDSGIDWLTLYIPMSALSTAYNVGGYPFDKDITEHLEWINLIEFWLAEIAQYVYSLANFKLALIGLEISGLDYSSKVIEKGVPSKRGPGYLWEVNNELKYYRSNWHE